MPEVDQRTCPVCGTAFERYVPTEWHCPECDRDYWIEGDSWWSCDVSGEPELVETATDGGERDGYEYSWYDPEAPVFETRHEAVGELAVTIRKHSSMSPGVAGGRILTWHKSESSNQQTGTQ